MKDAILRELPIYDDATYILPVFVTPGPFKITANTSEDESYTVPL